MVHLDRRYGLRVPPRVRYPAINPLAEDVQLLMARSHKTGTHR